MILAVDIGNSSVTFGVFDATELTETFMFPTSEIIFGVNAEELQQKLNTLQQIKNVVIASVVPDATDNLRLVIATSIISATCNRRRAHRADLCSPRRPHHSV